ncbi:MAG: hypothetical protein AAFX87_29380 [Bacteroidota bacterium]
MKVFTSLLTFLSILIYNTGCQQSAASNTETEVVVESSVTESDFNAYWYQGKAEIAAYNLKQSRYGQIHEGKAVLIFVTEDFSKSKQVKLDYPQRTPDDKVSAMKLNFTKKFNTGIYPYSMMLSTFTPVDSYHHPDPLKLTMSSQEWCGHVFAQMNLGNDQYDLSSYSYFEQEGDVALKVKEAFLEDEIWTRIRLDYKTLPTGKVKMLPGLFYSRLLHKEFKPVDTKAALTEDGDQFKYSVDFVGKERVLNIWFDKAFPHKIRQWEETAKSPWGKTLTTTAVLDETLYTDYWSKNGNEHKSLRDSLNLPNF